MSAAQLKSQTKTSKLRRYLVFSGVYATGAAAFAGLALGTSGSGKMAVTIAYSISAAGFAMVAVGFLLLARARHA